MTPGCAGRKHLYPPQKKNRKIHQVSSVQNRKCRPLECQLDFRGFPISLPNSVLSIRHHLIHKVQVTFELLQWSMALDTGMGFSRITGLSNKILGTSLEHLDKLDWINIG